MKWTFHICKEPTYCKINFLEHYCLRPFLVATPCNIAEVHKAKGTVKIGSSRRLQRHHAAETQRIQVVEVFLKNQHPPRLLSLGDTAETCRFFRGSVAPRLTSDAKSSKRLPNAGEPGRDGTGQTGHRRMDVSSEVSKATSILLINLQTHIQTQQAVTARAVPPEAVR